MRKAETEYYFSTIALFFWTIFIAIFLIGPSYLFIKFYNANLLVAIAFLLPLVFLLIGLPNYMGFMYCAFRKRPALILNEECLINNANRKVYRWSEIKSISYQPHTGFKAPPGGYISVTLKDSKRSFRISPNLIKCKTEKLLQDIQKYHKGYHR